MSSYLDLLEEIFNKDANRVAIKAYGKSITYGQLDEESNKLITLFNSVTQKNIRRVAIYGEGSVEHFATMLFCIKMNITFINVDVSWPKEYIAKICADLKIDYCFYKKQYQKIALNQCDGICIDDIDAKPTKSFDLKQARLSYIVTTSGTTGTAKYVLKKEEALIRSYKQMLSDVQIMSGGIAQQYSSLSFAYGLDQSLIMLISRKTICIGSRDTLTNLDTVYKNIAQNKADTAFFPASIIKLLSKNHLLFENIPTCLKAIVGGGEPLVVSADFIFEMRNHDIVLYNNYGSTETGTIFFSKYQPSILDIEEYNKVPVGARPLNGFQVKIINDQNGNEMSILCENFYNEYIETEKEQHNFIFSRDGSALVEYRTGDIADFNDSNYYIIGRGDNVVNIRGYRVSIEYIESVIMQILKGEECCVVPIHNPFLETRLVCFYSADKFNAQFVKEKSIEMLPKYMVPIVFQKVDKIEHSKNGKIDRKKMASTYNLLEPTYSFNNAVLVGRIQDIFHRVSHIDINDKQIDLSFERLGLDSIDIASAICLVEDEEKTSIPMSLIADKKIMSIRTLCEYIEKKKREN